MCFSADCTPTAKSLALLLVYVIFLFEGENIAENRGSGVKQNDANIFGSGTAVKGGDKEGARNAQV